MMNDAQFFVYENDLNIDSRRASRTLYRARTKNGKLVVVKFVRKYSQTRVLRRNCTIAIDMTSISPIKWSSWSFIERDDMYGKLFTKTQTEDIRRAKAYGKRTTMRLGIYAAIACSKKAPDK